jgi:hypothetical protein
MCIAEGVLMMLDLDEKSDSHAFQNPFDPTIGSKLWQRLISSSC